LLAVDDKDGHPQGRQRAAPVTRSDDRGALASGVFFGAAVTLEGPAADVPDGRLVERVPRRSGDLLQRDRCFCCLFRIGDRSSGVVRYRRSGTRSCKPCAGTSNGSAPTASGCRAIRPYWHRRSMRC
jgi:hypothetical protein